MVVNQTIDEKPKLKAEQIAAIRHDNGNLLLSASAGSGKTFVMINRIIRLIREGKADVKNILAVTFTEASANDMKLKLQKALIDAYAEEKNERFVGEINDIPTANISTLHSFCMSLIQKYYYVADVLPDFRIADDSLSKALKSSAVDKLFNDLYERGEQYFKDLCELHFRKRNDKKFKETIVNLYDYADTEASPDVFLENTCEIYTHEKWGELINSFCSDYVDLIDGYKKQLEDEKEKVKADEKLFVICEKVLAYVDSVKNKIKSQFASDDNNKLSLPKQCDENYMASLLRIRSLKERISQIQDECKDLLNCFKTDELLLEEYKEHVCGLVKITKEFGKYYSQAKAEENVLDFNDLEHYALKILNDVETQKEISGEFKYVFVDECQDINGVQNAIIEKIANGNLFKVGDVKQSIYGFRGCRPELFKEEFELLQNTEGAKRLNYNFRSAPEIIKAVNNIFSYSMDVRTYGESYEGSELKEGGVYDQAHKGRVKFHNLLSEETNDSETKTETPRVYDLYEEFKKEKKEKIADIAAFLSKIIEEELGLDYYDFKTKTEKQVGYGDIVILTRNKENAFVQKIVSGLSNNGVPVVSSVEQKVCDYAEIKLLINLLQLIECLDNDIPLGSVLKSPIGSFNETELMQIVSKTSEQVGKVKRFYHAYCYYRDNFNDELSKKIQEFEKYYRKIRFLSEFESAGDMLDRVILDKNLEAFWLATPQGKDKIKRIRTFISASRKETGDYGVRQFLDYIEKSGDEIKLNRSDATENAVTVMTIHASKGLEFPVVIFCGAERELLSRKRNEEEIVKDRTFGFAVNCYDKCNKIISETVFVKYAKKQRDKKSIADELRLFYVALTRAMYSLHIVAENAEWISKIEPKTFVDFIPPDFEREDVSLDKIMFESWSKGRRTVLCGDAKHELVEKMDGNFAFSYANLLGTELPLKTSVTGALTLGKTEEQDEEKSKAEKIADEIIKDGGTDTDSEKGIIAHKILELTDFTRPFDEQITEIIEKGNLKDIIEKVDLEKIKNCVELIKEKIGSGKTYREKSFLCNIPACEIYPDVKKEHNEGYGTPILVQGIIDLLVIEEGKAKIIDYKYSHKNEEQLKETYKKQLDLYAYAVEKGFENVKVVEKVIISLVKGKSITL